MKSVEVVCLGLEGGGAQVFGRVVDGKWRFSQSGSSLDIDENDQEFWNSWRKDEVADLEQALPDIWALMHPIRIHPRFVTWFRDRYEAACARIPEHLRESQRQYVHDNWQRALGTLFPDRQPTLWQEGSGGLSGIAEKSEGARPRGVKVPFQNRVTPFGQIIAHPARGTFMGNRGGCFHDHQKQLTKSRWAGKSWIICLLAFRGRKRDVMTPGHYTELFFWDEATALAAGHRPCKECRRADHERFKEAWLRGNPGVLPDGTGIDGIDARLHQERVVSRTRAKVTYPAVLGDLPDGAFIVLAERPETALLVWEKTLWPWFPDDYGEPIQRDNGQQVTVLTPRSTVASLKAGYRHEVAFGTNGLERQGG